MKIIVKSQRPSRELVLSKPRFANPITLLKELLHRNVLTIFRAVQYLDKARRTLKHVFNIIFYLFSFQENQVYSVYRNVKNTSAFTSECIPEFLELKRSCKVYYLKDNVFTWCTAPQCNLYLYFMAAKMCCQEWHSWQFQRKYICKYSNV